MRLKDISGVVPVRAQPLAITTGCRLNKGAVSMSGSVRSLGTKGSRAVIRTSLLGKRIGGGLGAVG